MVQTEQTEQSSTRELTRIKPPSKYNVVLLNDDATPMDFVIQLLVSIFNKTDKIANDITLEVHEKGRAIAGTYMFEVSEQKCTEVLSGAKLSGYPLAATVEQAE